MADSDVWAIIAGGGTAGHVQPALAIADALVSRGHDPRSIHYVGSERGIEATLVPDAGYPLTLLPGRGIQRTLTFANVGAVLGILRAFARALTLVRRLRPRVVVAVGGYASVPVALAAVVWRVPIVVAEQNARPGAANRLVARFAKVAAVSFPDTPLPRAVVTGNPVRADVVRVDRARDGEAARAALGIEADRSVVLVMGGSLGARRINLAALDAISQWRDRGDLAVRHLVGARDWDDVNERMPLSEIDGKLQYQRIKYEDEMPRALAASDLAVCRSGSSTCFELCAVGLPSVLVPSPNVTADHQTANARHLADAGAAVLLPESELVHDRLATAVDGLLADQSLLASMAQAAKGMARPDAATAIAELVEQQARD